MRPEVRTVTLDGRSEEVMNATAVIELARSAGTPQARALLEAYHRTEADIAKEKPFLSEATIRAEAVIKAFRSLGGVVKHL